MAPAHASFPDVDPATAARLARLGPDTRVTLYHGTDTATAVRFCLGGVDAREPRTNRRYAQHSLDPRRPLAVRHGAGDPAGVPVTRGLFVTASPRLAASFGGAVVALAVRGRDLFYRHPDRAHARAVDAWCRPHFPESFRPGVSSDLLHDSAEPQALLVGLVPREAVCGVSEISWGPDGSCEHGVPGRWRLRLDREGFLAWAERMARERGSAAGLAPTPPAFLVDERPDGAAFVRRLAAHHGVEEAEIAETLRHFLSSEAGPVAPTDRTAATVRAVLGGPGCLPYTVVRRALPSLLAHLGLARRPTAPTLAA